MNFYFRFRFQRLFHKLNLGLWSLINNAGICIYGEFEWLTEEHCERLISVNLSGTISVTRTFLSLIKEAKGNCAMPSNKKGGSFSNDLKRSNNKRVCRSFIVVV